MIPEEDTQRQQIEQIVQDVLARNNIQQGGARNVLTRGAFQSPIYSPGLRGWKIDSEGRAEFNDLWVTGMVKTVSVGESIQDAINTLNKFGGGEIRLDAGTHTLTDDITIYSGISLVGVGRDSTILEFSGSANGILIIGTSTAIKKNFKLADFTLQNSNNTAGIDIDYCDFWKIENIRVTSCDQAGIRIKHSQYFLILNVRSDSNTGDGFDFVGQDSRRTTNFQLINCQSESNGAIGFSFNNVNANGLIQVYVLNGCEANSNTGDGFDWSGSISSAFDERGTVIGCRSITNGGIGFDINTQSVPPKDFIGCAALTNTGDGFQIDYDDLLFDGCRTGNESSSWNINANVGIVGCQSGTTSMPGTNMVISSSARAAGARWYRNDPTNAINENLIWRMKNRAGTTVPAGSVVVWYTGNSRADEFSTTTTGGDNKVIGMTLASIGNEQIGRILIEGFTDQLKVDGTTDIAVGDFLSCFTTAGIAKKAIAGDTVFAIALEAYTTNDSNGVIDAVLISPRLI